MNIHIGSIEITITRRKVSPLEKLTTIAVDRRASKIIEDEGFSGSPKIPRIKAIREIVPGTRLKDAFEWVVKHYDNDGNGLPL